LIPDRNHDFKEDFMFRKRLGQVSQEINSPLLLYLVQKKGEETLSEPVSM
jgi:hypothetical protein